MVAGAAKLETVTSKVKYETFLYIHKNKNTHHLFKLSMHILVFIFSLRQTNKHLVVHASPPSPTKHNKNQEKKGPCLTFFKPFSFFYFFFFSLSSLFLPFHKKPVLLDIANAEGVWTGPEKRATGQRHRASKYHLCTSHEHWHDPVKSHTWPCEKYPKPAFQSILNPLR